MKRLAKWMGILISVLFLSGSAWAYDAQDHIKAAPNGKGDLLFFKYYVVANGGWETKISVTNTNMAASVVAKVVIRSYKNSTELLDFLIYLSPADVWTAKLYWDGTQTKIYSEDSSCLNAEGTFASPEKPLDYALKTIGTGRMPFCPDDSTAVGYIYVVQSAYASEGPFKTAGVTKAAIKTNYELYYYDPVPTVTTTTAGYFQTYGDTTTWNNSLLGYEVFSNQPTGLFSSAVQAQAMQDYGSYVYLKLTETNVLGTQTPIQEANNTLAEIEAALSKSGVSLPYVEKDAQATVHVIGFPTKYSKGTCAAITANSPFFTKWMDSNFKLPMYGVTIWNTNEVYSSSQIFSPSPTSGLRDEVNLIAVSGLNADDFEEGWVSYPFIDSSNAVFSTSALNAAGDTLTYKGAPVLSAVVFFGLTDAYAIDGAWTDGDVTVAGTVDGLPGYQYSNAYTPFVAQ